MPFFYRKRAAKSGFFLSISISNYEIFISIFSTFAPELLLFNYCLFLVRCFMYRICTTNNINIYY